MENAGNILNARQIRAGRAFLGWTARELGRRADVSLATVQRLETSGPSLHAAFSTVEKVLGAFRRAGVDFPDAYSVSFRRPGGDVDGGG